MSDSFPFLKGHGTENDFVLLPDRDGIRHSALDAGLVSRLCDRRAGIGADGVLRAVRADAYDDPAAVAARGEATWFMDYRNADGSVSEMCGNGIRVFARYLVQHEGVDPAQPIAIGTRAGVLTVTYDAVADVFTADMGAPQVLGETKVAVGTQSWPATHVSMGNPHAVAFVDSLAPADGLGRLDEPPSHDQALFPDGVNVEFVALLGRQHISMRVHERGSGETRSCGTGACAAVVATTVTEGSPRNTPYQVDVPGGTLHVTWTGTDAGGRVLLAGPAVLVAEGNWLVDPRMPVAT